MSPRARLRRLFMSASEPDTVQKRWTLRIWANVRGNVNAAEYKFWTEAKHIDEVFELLYANGFACVRKNHLGHIVPSGKFEIRVSTGEL